MLDWRDELIRCTRCGFCLSRCPVYALRLSESASPRGRITLMRAVAENRLPADHDFARALQMCLGCRACETACPSGVGYGPLLEAARHHAAIGPGQDLPPLGRLVLNAVADGRRLGLLFALLRLYRRSLKPVLYRSGLAAALPRRLQAFEAALPAVPGHNEIHPPVTVADGEPRRGLTIGYFNGCVMDAAFRSTNQRAVWLLRHLGYQVLIPKNQYCCGALHAHAGRNTEAVSLARRNLDAFRELPDLIVSSSGACVSHLREYPRLLADDPTYADAAVSFAARVKDIGSLLAERPPQFRPAGRKTVRAVFQQSCLLANVNSTGAPRDLLAALPGIELVDDNNGDCCGGAGLFPLLNPELSVALTAKKIAHFRRLDPDLIVTINPGCHLQLAAGLERSKQNNIELMHLVDLVYQFVID